MVFIVRKINPFESCGQIYVTNIKHHQPKQKKEKEKNYDIVINVNPYRNVRGRSKTETTETTTTLESENTLSFSAMSQSRRKRHEKGLEKHVLQNIPYPFPNPQQEKQKKQPKSGFISSFLKGRNKGNNSEIEILSIKQDNHFQSMIGILAQLRAVCKVTMEISAELTTEVNKIGHKIVSINHRLEAAKRKTIFHISVKSKGESSTTSRIQILASNEHKRAKLNELGQYTEPLPTTIQKTLIGIPEALKHRYDKRCHKDPQFHPSSDNQLITISSIIFKDHKEIPTNGHFCSFIHDVEILKWIKEGHMTKCAEIYSFPKLFQLKWNENRDSSIRGTSSIDDTFDDIEPISDATHHDKPVQILLEKKGKTMPKIVTNYLNRDDLVSEDNKHASVNLNTESFHFFKELSFGSSSTRTSTSSCSNGTVVCNTQKHGSIIDLIESQIFRHVDNSMEWQAENEKKKPRNKRDSLLYINEEYYAKSRCRERFKESIKNYQKNKRLIEDIKVMESDNDGSQSSDTGSVIRISKASFSTTDRPRPSSIDTIASALNIDFDDSPPNVISKDARDARLSMVPYYNYLVNGNKKSTSSDSSDDDYDDNSQYTQTDTLSNLPSIFNIIEESKKNIKKNAPLILTMNHRDPTITGNAQTNHQVSHFEKSRRRAVIDMDGEELNILHTLRTEDTPSIKHRATEEDDESIHVSDMAFSFGPITTLTQEVISIDKISERVQKSRPLIQSHLHNTVNNRSVNVPKKRNIDNNHPVLGKVIQQQPKIVHPHFEESEDEYSSTDEETDTISDFPRSERIIQPSSFISDATLLGNSTFLEPTPLDKPVETSPISLTQLTPHNEPPKETKEVPPPKIIEPNKSLFKEEISHFKSFRPSTSSYSSALSFDEGFLDSVVPITQVSTNSKHRINNKPNGQKISHLSPSIDFDLPSSYEYSLKIMELEHNKHNNSHFYTQDGSMCEDDENYTYSDDEYDDGMYHIPESHQSRYIPSDSSFSDMDSF